eukprot:TRINITY_DN23492_c0_g1_i1.p1 TRINITY_DN23492_c0_g1~~TRINITY_DN23492_c0_g1_i1.p1  ORF type:complete len:547 (-),score=105.26 TRINITY_DN23492_c0_g1_i1:50-1690(-)
MEKRDEAATAGEDVLACSAPEQEVKASPGEQLRAGIALRLQAVERFAEAEIRRLEDNIADLSRENERLLARLVDADPGASSNLLLAGNGTAKVKETRSPSKGSGSASDGSAGGMPKKYTMASIAEDTEDVKRAKQYLKDEGRKGGENGFRQYRENGIFQRIAKSPAFDNAAIFMIILNALWIPVDMDLNDSMTLFDARLEFQIVENFFCVVFILELVIRFCAFQKKCHAFREKWFLFDFFMVMTMVLDSWVLSCIVYFSGQQGPDGLRMISFLRVVRLLRVTRMARLARMVPELLMMTHGMLAGLRSVCTAAVLLAGVTYVFAIVMRQITEDSELGTRYFHNVPASIYTLLGESMIPDNFMMLNALWEEHWYIGLTFFIFLFFSSLTIMNMLIGLICEVLHNASLSQKADVDVEKMTRKLQSILKAIDADYNGMISKKEFMNILYSKEAVKLLQQVGVDVHAILEDIDHIFAGGSTSELPFEDFKEIMLSFRATNATTMRGLANVRKMLRASFEVVNDRLTLIEAVLVQRDPEKATDLQPRLNTSL